MKPLAKDAVQSLVSTGGRRRRIFTLKYTRSILLALTVAWATDVFATGGGIVPQSTWRLQEGSPSKTITAVIQSKEGYLWMGTYDGLVRYDGVAYTLLNAPNLAPWHDDGVTSLYEAPDDTLWVGHARGGVSTMKNGVFEYHSPLSSGRFEKIQSLAADEQGDIWALDSSGRLRRMRDNFEISPQSSNPGNLLGMTRLSNGHIWLTSGSHLYSLENSSLRLESNADAGEPLPGVQAAGASRDGGLWIVAGGILWKWKPGSPRVEVAKLALPFTAISAILEAQDGRVFISTAESGMEILTPGSESRQSVFARSTHWVTDCALCLGEDHEGGVWLGTGGAGIFKLHETRVRSLVPPDTWEGRAVLTTCPAGDGGFWVGTEGAGLYRLYPDGTWKKNSVEGGLQNPYVWALYQERGGPLWIGNWEGLDVLQDGRISAAPGSANLPSPIFAIAPARDGGLWIGGRKGVAHYHRGEVRWLEPEGERTLIQVHAIVELPDGVLWVSSDGAGLARVQEGHITHFFKRDGLSTDYLRGLLLDEDGTVWVGSRDGGLMRVRNGRVAVIGIANGLADATISDLIDDGLGYLWMNSHAGILRVSKRELNDCADGRIKEVHCLNYRQADGLKSLLCASSQQAMNCTTPEGLVFCSDQDLQLVDPKKVRLNTHVPPVVIEEVRVGGVKVAAPGPLTSPLRVGPGAGRIEIAYTGLSFAEPALVRFKYRLEGLEPEWVQAGTERHAVYNAVPPGSYVFAVLATNNDNVWNLEGSKLAVVVLPHFWQTLWFRLSALILLLLATGAIVWLQTRARLMRKLERMKLDRAVQDERTRIANDMHDDLGAHLTHIAMLSDTARSNLDDREKAREGLTQIYEQARNITRATDEIVWAINPRHDTLESLINYCEKFAQDLLAASGIRCEFDFPVEIPEMCPHSEVRHNIFLAYKEAVNNAVKHSRANLVTIALVVDERGGRLTVADNGHGMVDTQRVSPPAKGRIATGNGLGSMSRRMLQIGGTCEVTGTPGEGCTVILSFPWKRPAH